MPAGHTPLYVLAGPLHRLPGSDRFYNLLERNGFASVEEVAATPESCWFELRNCGTRFIAAVRQVIAELQPDDTQAKTGSFPGCGGAGRPVTLAGLPADTARALQLMAACAVAEHGARTLGGPSDARPRRPGPAAGRRPQLGPPRPARSPAVGRGGAARRRPAQLACDLLDEVEERRRLILTSRTFAPARRTYDSLAAELGVGRERVRQLETSALQQLARAAGPDRCRTLRWRAASAARPGAPTLRSPTHRHGWARCCPGWQANPPDARAAYPLLARPASSVLMMRARAFKASLEPVTQGRRPRLP